MNSDEESQGPTSPQEATRDPTMEEVQAPGSQDPQTTPKTSRPLFPPDLIRNRRRKFALEANGKTETPWIQPPSKKTKLHLISAPGAKEPMMASYHDRLAALMDMNVSMSDFSKMRRAKFAASGFFPFDCDWMKCFSCGIKIRGWENTDDPYITHVDQNPMCDHIWTVIKRRVSQGTLTINTKQEA